MHFRPCIDLHDGKVKQIVGSTLTDSIKSGPVTNFESDKASSYFADLYKADNLPGGHVIMLGPGNETAAKSALKAFEGGLQIGGGITPDNAQTYLDAGATHVIVTSYVISNGAIHWDRLSTMEKLVGKSRLVLDLSCKKERGSYIVVSDRWQTLTNVEVSAKTVNALAQHCDEFLVHAVDIEGKQQGIDVDLVTLLSELSQIPTTYAGGIRSIKDLKLVAEAGQGHIDATIGSALDIFGGALKYRDVVEWFSLCS
jgi:phosphoribosylformimino-5-aminoimidazole carboxamide ribotide isomerase